VDYSYPRDAFKTPQSKAQRINDFPTPQAELLESGVSMKGEEVIVQVKMKKPQFDS
jgi:hypothetical protein